MLATAALTEPTLPTPARSYLEQIVTQAESLAEIISHSLSADEPGRPAVRLTDLRQVTSEAAAAQRVTYRGQLEVLPHAVPLLTHVNRTDVRRIICNLLSNATQAAGPAGTVRIQACRDGGLAQFVVEDTGPGFGQIPEGTGLGWRIIVESLARCSGKIQFGQSALGGVRACLSLPLAANWAQGEPSQ
jgi:signal transduction histidine kinase